MKYTLELSRKSGKTLQKGNQMISSNDRMHRFIENQIKIYLRELGEQIVKANPPQTPFSEDRRCDIIITVYPPTARRMDPPNWYPTIKALIDGMVIGGLMTDDNSNVLRRTIFECGPKSGTKNYKLDLTFELIN